MNSQKTVSACCTELEIEIDAPPAEVWSAFVNDVASWWPADHRFTTGAMRLEAEPGGRLVELGDDGGGVVWGTVLALAPERSIDLVCHLAARYGGPATCFHRVRFEANGSGGTRLQVSDDILGTIADDHADKTHAGWTDIYGGLSRFVTGARTG